MKHRICITVDEETILKIRNAMQKKNFRNKSHLVEFAVNNFLGDTNGR